MASTSFVATGAEQTWVVPSWVTSIDVDIKGAAGGDSIGAVSAIGGKGGRVQATLVVTPGETLRMRVGVRGLDGQLPNAPVAGSFYGGTGAVAGVGGSGNGGGGAGASDVRRGGAADSFRVLVGGGGGGATNNSQAGGHGGNTLHTEATASVPALAPSVGQNNGGNGGGWVGGQADSPAGNDNGTGGSNMAHSTQTSAVTSTGAFQSGNGAIAFTYADGPATLLRGGTLYPRNSVTNDTGTGIDVRTLDDAQGATNETQTATATQANDNVERTFDPATAGVTNTNHAGTTLFKMGWAIPLAEMSPGGDTRCLAILKAQTVTVNVSATVAATTRGTVDVGGTQQPTWRASLWRYNLTANTAVLIAAGSNATQSWSTVLVTGDEGTFKTVVIPITVAAASEFAADEVLLLQLGLNTGTLTDATLGTTTYTFTVRSDAALTNISFEGMRQKCRESQVGIGRGASTKALIRPRVARAATGKGTATKTLVRVRGTRTATGVGVGAATRRVRGTRTATGVGVASSTRRTRATRAATGVGVPARNVRVRTLDTATGVGVPAFTRKWTAFREATATGVGTGSATRRTRHTRVATGVGVPTTTRHWVAFRSATATGVGVASSERRTRVVRAATAVGVPSFTRRWAAFRSATATGVGTTSFVRVVIFVRHLIVDGIGRPKARVEVDIDDLPEATGGTTIIVRPIFGNFD